jgi:hypothetical protein
VLKPRRRRASLPRVVDLLPNESQARKLVTSLAIFWGAWGIAVLGALGVAALSAAAVVVGLVFGFRFYLTLYEVWEPESGVSPWRMMFLPGFSRGRLRASLHLRDLLRPSWIGHTLRVTGWNAKFVGLGLLALLVTDLVLAAFVFPSLGATSPT